MKTNVAESSLVAYADLKSTGKLTARQQQVMSVIKPGRDYSLQELVMLCGLPINCVSGRVNELRKDGRLEFGVPRKCSMTNKTIHPVQLATPDGA